MKSFYEEKFVFHEEKKHVFREEKICLSNKEKLMSFVNSQMNWIFHECLSFSSK